MNATDVKAALAKRHPGFAGQMPGEWTVLEEWANIDLLAVSAWGKGRRIGYEVKVSRSDYRRELLRPDKRTRYVAACHEFYFAVPAGLLKADELVFAQPNWPAEAWRPVHCTAGCQKLTKRARRNHEYTGGVELPKRGTVERVPVPTTNVVNRWSTFDGWTYVTCRTCGGTGTVEKSLVERDAPTLWVPPDVGLVEVHESGVTRAVKKAPYRHTPAPLVTSDRDLGQLVRWISMRPDQRHHNGSSYEEAVDVA